MAFHLRVYAVATACLISPCFGAISWTDNGPQTVGGGNVATLRGDSVTLSNGGTTRGEWEGLQVDITSNVTGTISLAAGPFESNRGRIDWSPNNTLINNGTGTAAILLSFQFNDELFSAPRVIDQSSGGFTRAAMAVRQLSGPAFENQLAIRRFSDQNNDLQDFFASTNAETGQALAQGDINYRSSSGAAFAAGSGSGTAISIDANYGGRSAFNRFFDPETIIFDAVQRGGGSAIQDRTHLTSLVDIGRTTEDFSYNRFDIFLLLSPGETLSRDAVFRFTFEGDTRGGVTVPEPSAIVPLIALVGAGVLRRRRTI